MARFIKQGDVYLDTASEDNMTLTLGQLTELRDAHKNAPNYATDETVRDFVADIEGVL